MKMLTIKDLNVSIHDDKQGVKSIIRGLNLSINKGEVHAIMGPNGSGKSTLSNVLAGREDYTVESGNIEFKQHDLLLMSPEERAQAGIFLSFQYPVEIPGVNNMYFLRSSLNSIRQAKGLSPIDAADFLKIAKAKIKEVGFDDTFLHRAVNDSFSGGEKKRNEILQMLVLEPQFIILDEMDSGLDVDALQHLSQCVNSMRNDDRCILMVTHYDRLLQHIMPDYVHIMVDGRIIKSGDKTLAHKIEQQGYAWLLNEATL